MLTVAPVSTTISIVFGCLLLFFSLRPNKYSSSELVLSCVCSARIVCIFFLDLHTFEKWLSLPQLLHALPLAGQGSMWGKLPPHL